VKVIKASWLYVAAVAAALAVDALFIVLMGRNPAEALGAAISDSLGSVGGLSQTLNKMSPLLLSSLAVALGLRAGLFNIGVDGQIYVGAIFATGMAFILGPSVPPIAMIPTVLMAGIVGGAVWAMVPAVLKVSWGINEIFVTVMLNFVAGFLAEYLTTGPWNDPTAGEAITRAIPASAVLPMLIPRGGAHAGILLSILAALGIALLLFHTVLGYELRATGDNPRAARIAGIGLAKVTLWAFGLSGALAGLSGGIEVSGIHNRLLLGLTPGYGIMGILIAVLARNHPVALVPVTFLFAVLVAASDSLQRSAGFPASAVFVVQALILLVILWAEAAQKVGQRIGKASGDTTL
jgi:ABC-type uncharacterized transport system permease subunit